MLFFFFFFFFFFELCTSFEYSAARSCFLYKEVSGSIVPRKCCRSAVYKPFTKFAMAQLEAANILQLCYKESDSPVGGQGSLPGGQAGRRAGWWVEVSTRAPAWPAGCDISRVCMQSAESKTGQLELQFLEISKHLRWATQHLKALVVDVAATTQLQAG